MKRAVREALASAKEIIQKQTRNGRHSNLLSFDEEQALSPKAKREYYCEFNRKTRYLLSCYEKLSESATELYKTYVDYQEYLDDLTAGELEYWSVDFRDERTKTLYLKTSRGNGAMTGKGWREAHRLEVERWRFRSNVEVDKYLKFKEYADGVQAMTDALLALNDNELDEFYRVMENKWVT